MEKQTILLSLNELNFGYIKKYIEEGQLPNFKALFDNHPLIETSSESKYELLEPWIQWVTVHTGLTYDEHKVYRLGDIVERKELNQIWEELEKQGVKVGALSPFNADNRLKNPKFFIPDPWTKTTPSGNWLVKKIYKAIHQTVNENAQENIQLSSAIGLGLGILAYIPMSQWMSYFRLFKERKLPGVKAIILDKMFGDIFYTLWKKSSPQFSSLFLNTGAHIQHHYLFNSKQYKGDLKNPEWYCPKNYDPLIKILKIYDQVIGKLNSKNINLIVATGLHQKPHKHLTFYWRLKNHKNFIDKIGIKNCTEVLPRMSRDFLLKFANEENAKKAALVLESYISDKDNMGIFAVDNRGLDLFVELVYPKEIDKNFTISSKTAPSNISFYEDVVFVAIKNGEHDGTGYLITNFKNNLNTSIELKKVNKLITDTVLETV